MNASQTPKASSTPNPAPSVVVALSALHVHRERDFGVGYGNSSGYASNRKYASQCATPRFKCA